ncbi:hypothetical protein EHQ52_14865 [Leptospira koniambonensis]|uniref:Uncharacterized protein n=1 Tax=Leptospira koniambonensis TaxID=2484950 RepID=A0A4R9J470_9LEPT|nr:hypothetical protein [Leptospira koniambonensis]TGL32562.1 hypothetical protein EHQ52_14865 [Leptospira koniambonensis]
MPEERKKYLEKVSFDQAIFIKDAKVFHQEFRTNDAVYSVMWENKNMILAESFSYKDERETFTYQDKLLSMKAKSKKFSFDPYYKIDIPEGPQNEDSIYYFIK